jgi:hypothetical protein
MEILKQTNQELRHGVLTVGPDVVRVVSDGSFNCKQGVLLYADRSNTVPIFVGGQGMTTDTGMPIWPSENICIPIDDASRVYVCADESSKLNWMLV